LPLADARVTARAHGLARALRLARVALHLAGGCAISAWLYPLANAKTRRTLRRAWAARLLRILGAQVDVGVARIAPGSLVVANHVSWLDAVVLHAALPVAVVAKADARHWPLLGRLLERNDTLFVERRASRDLLRVNREIAARLARGERVAAFPEGTTTDGARVLPFRPALFQPAVAGSHPLHALALVYRDGAGRRCAEAAYIDDMSLWQSLWRIAALKRLRIELRCCGVHASAGLRRREAAALTRAEIQRGTCASGALPERQEQSGFAGSGSPAGWLPSSTAPTWASDAEVSRT
jgi:1-acyl-sn-glycerol-3-phosphate acyltransferase